MYYMFNFDWKYITLCTWLAVGSCSECLLIIYLLDWCVYRGWKWKWKWTVENEIVSKNSPSLRKW